MGCCLSKIPFCCKKNKIHPVEKNVIEIKKDVCSSSFENESKSSYSNAFEITEDKCSNPSSENESETSCTNPSKIIDDAPPSSEDIENKRKPLCSTEKFGSWNIENDERNVGSDSKKSNLCRFDSSDNYSDSKVDNVDGKFNTSITAHRGSLEETTDTNGKSVNAENVENDLEASKNITNSSKRNHFDHTEAKHELYKMYMCGFSAADEIALSAADELKYSQENLLEYLTAPFRDNPLLMVRVIWRWITDNIKYDVESFFNPKHKSTRSKKDDVLVSGKSVCAGYGNLFKTMCQHVGLQVKCVSGWAKGYSYKIGSTFSCRPPDHMWNTVLLNGRWWLLDPTWGAGHIDTNKTFVKRYNEYFFLTDPKTFIYDHFPEDAEWQLLGRL